MLKLRSLFPLLLLGFANALVQLDSIGLEALEKGNGHYGCRDCERPKKPCLSSSSSCSSSSSLANPNVFFQQCCKSENVVDDLVWLQPDVGFYAFGFQSGNIGGKSCQRFYVNAPTCTLLWVLDCYCPGDMFQVTVEGSTVMYNPEVYRITLEENFGNNCANYEPHPFNCLKQPELFARNLEPIVIPAGFHTITIDILVSMYREGTGYLLLMSADPLYNFPACIMDTSSLYPCDLNVFYPYNPFAKK